MLITKNLSVARSFLLSVFILQVLIYTLVSLNSFTVSALKVATPDFKFVPQKVKVAHDAEDETGSDFDDDGQDYDHHSEKPRQSLHKLLESNGLGIVTDTFSDFFESFEVSKRFFSSLNTDQTFEVLNRFVYSFAQTFTTIFGPLASGKGAPTGPLMYTQIKDLLDKQESTLKAVLIKDEKILSSEWASFIGKIHMLFESLKNLCKLANNSGFTLQWWMVSVIVLAMDKVPEDLFVRSTYSDILGLPTTFHQTVHDAIEGLFYSDMAPLIKIVASTLTNYQRQKHQEQRESEL